MIFGAIMFRIKLKMCCKGVCNNMGVILLATCMGSLSDAKSTLWAACFMVKVLFLKPKTF